MLSLLLLVVVFGLWLVQTAVSRMAAVAIGAAFWTVVAVVARGLGVLIEGESRLESVELTIAGTDAFVDTAPLDAYNGDDSMDMVASDALRALGILVYGDDDDDDSMEALAIPIHNVQDKAGDDFPSCPVPILLTPAPNVDCSGCIMPRFPNCPHLLHVQEEEDEDKEEEEDDDDDDDDDDDLADLADDSIDSICESALAFTDSNHTTIFTQHDEPAMDLDDDDNESNTSLAAYGHIQNHLDERTKGIVTEFYELPAHEREPSVEEEQSEQVSEASPSLVSLDATVGSARPDEAIQPEVVAEPAQAARSVHPPPHKDNDPEEYQSVDSGFPASSTTAFSDGTLATTASPSDDGEKQVKVDVPVGRCLCSSVPRVQWMHLLNAKPELVFLTTCSHRPPSDVVKKPGVVKRTKTALSKVLRRRKGGKT
ncbi:hypothetical protein MKEN_00764800 [Mycena kentingensis (nom. inval.)]|nr:hypothetical protein MKEN_00764800 [Mycena kentingensis (nom. inval.)]